MSGANGAVSVSTRAQAVVFEAAGYSPLRPMALNCFAPAEANMHLLEAVAEERQKEEWLRPLAAGEIRSCFMMTEPAPGAGADPSTLQTTAHRDGADFVIDGTKWLITGAVGASVATGRGDDVPRTDERRRGSMSSGCSTPLDRFMADKLSSERLAPCCFRSTVCALSKRRGVT
jgi:alkylation response protein AidB-like acyl-CoA dehydrogenase